MFKKGEIYTDVDGDLYRVLYTDLWNVHLEFYCNGWNRLDPIPTLHALGLLHRIVEGSAIPA